MAGGAHRAARRCRFAPPAARRRAVRRCGARRDLQRLERHALPASPLRREGHCTRRCGECGLRTARARQLNKGLSRVPAHAAPRDRSVSAETAAHSLAPCGRGAQARLRLSAQLEHAGSQPTGCRLAVHGVRAGGCPLSGVLSVHHQQNKRPLRAKQKSDVLDLVLVVDLCGRSTLEGFRCIAVARERLAKKPRFRRVRAVYPRRTSGASVTAVSKTPRQCGSDHPTGDRSSRSVCV
jgi:hypothetical protein